MSAVAVAEGRVAVATPDIEDVRHQRQRFVEQRGAAAGALEVSELERTDAVEGGAVPAFAQLVDAGAGHGRRSWRSNPVRTSASENGTPGASPETALATQAPA